MIIKVILININDSNNERMVILNKARLKLMLDQTRNLNRDKNNMRVVDGEIGRTEEAREKKK